MGAQAGDDQEQGPGFFDPVVADAIGINIKTLQVRNTEHEA